MIKQEIKNRQRAAIVVFACFLSAVRVKNQVKDSVQYGEIGLSFVHNPIWCYKEDVYNEKS